MFEGLDAFVACRLIPLDKDPGVRPIGIGEIHPQIIAKAISWILSTDIEDAAGPLQVCAGPLRVQSYSVKMSANQMLY